MARIKNRVSAAIALIILSLIIIPSFASSESRILINSADWKDVYSGTLYATLKGIPSNFLTSTRHATIITYSIPKNLEGIEVLTGRSNPFVTNYPSILKADDYSNITEVRLNNGNLDLARKLPDIKKFIVLDDSYGYNSISVAPLAVIGKYYVLFANRRNIGQITDFLTERGPSEIIVYGQVNREVKNALQRYDPITINTGDRFDNNIEIVKRYQDIHKQIYKTPRKQAILTNGEFIESSIMSGADPVLFIGFSNVPDQVRAYLSKSDLEVGTLVGNELIGSATFVRRQTGLSVFVKFGQGARVPSDTIAQVEDLDRFPIPRYQLNLAIVTVIRNTATGNLEITYQNKAPIATYFKNLILRVNSDGDVYTIPDDSDASFIDANSYKSIVFPLIDADGNKIDFRGDNNTLDITTIFGESPKSLEQTLTAQLKIQDVSIVDGAEIEIVSVEFSQQRGAFLVKVKNIGNVDAYAVAEIQDLYVNGEYLIVSSEGVEKIAPGQTVTLIVKTEMRDEDILENQKVRVKVVYGERENSLIKSKEATFDFKLAAPELTIYIIILLVVLLLILIFLRKKCKNCGYRNPFVRKTCLKCRSKL